MATHMNIQMHSNDDVDDDTPQCIGKYIGQRIQHAGHVWVWQGEFWKKVA